MKSKTRKKLYMISYGSGKLSVFFTSLAVVTFAAGLVSSLTLDISDRRDIKKIINKKQQKS